MIQVDTATLTIVGSILVAVIGAIGLYVARKTRGPVTIQDAWEQTQLIAERNNTLTGRVDVLEAENRRVNAKYDDQLRINRIMGDGFDALTNAVERSNVKIDFLPSEHQAIERARSLRSDDEIWQTLNVYPKE